MDETQILLDDSSQPETTVLPHELDPMTDSSPKYSGLFQSVFQDGSIQYNDQIGKPEDFPLTEAELAELKNALSS